MPDVLSDNEIQVTPPAEPGADCLNGGIAATGVCAVAVTVTTPDGTSLTPSNGGPAILPAYSGPIDFNPDGSFTPSCATAATPTCEEIQAPEEYDYADAPTVSSVTVQGGGGYADEFGGSVAVGHRDGVQPPHVQWVNVGAAGPNTNEDFDVLSVSPTSLTVALPSDPNGPPTIEADPSVLSVQSASGLSGTGSFAFAGVPLFGSITSPSTPIIAQATPGSVSVTGLGLSDVDAVSTELEQPLNFIASTTTDITSQTDTALTAELDSNFAFPQDVVLCSATGCSTPSSEVGGTADVLYVAYPGRPVVSSSSPTTGPAYGGTTVTIDGALNTEVLAVDFGSVPAGIVSEGALTASAPIVVDAPPGVPGTTVNITIETAGGVLVGDPTSAISSAARFSYADSTPSAPENATASAGPGLISVSWTAPGIDGGKPITGYRVTATASSEATLTRIVGPAQRSTLFAPVANAQWTFSVQALNALGSGLAATTSSVAPGALPLQGYWLSSSSGAVSATGYAPTLAGTSVSSSDPIVGVATSPGGGGYWLVSKDGKVFARGSAAYEGELGSGVTDIVSIAGTEDGLGYWLVSAKGQVYPFGDAVSQGQVPSSSHVGDVVGIGAYPSGGYLLVTKTGKVYAFGAPSLGGAPSTHSGSIRGIVAAPTGTGYLIFTTTGEVFRMGTGLPLARGAIKGVTDIRGLALTPDDDGYWLVAKSGATYLRGDAIKFGKPSGLKAHGAVVGIAAT